VPQLLDVDANMWVEEAARVKDFYGKFGDHTPKALWDEHAALASRASSSTKLRRAYEKTSHHGDHGGHGEELNRAEVYPCGETRKLDTGCYCCRF